MPDKYDDGPGKHFELSVGPKGEERFVTGPFCITAHFTNGKHGFELKAGFVRVELYKREMTPDTSPVDFFKLLSMRCLGVAEKAERMMEAEGSIAPGAKPNNKEACGPDSPPDHILKECELLDSERRKIYCPIAGFKCTPNCASYRKSTPDQSEISPGPRWLAVAGHCRNPNVVVGHEKDDYA